MFKISFLTHKNSNKFFSLKFLMKYYVVLNSLCKLIILVKFRSLTFFNFQFKWKNVSIKQILFTHNLVIGVDLSSSIF
jgi:hypothetical protein